MDLIRRGRNRLGKKLTMKRLETDTKVQVALIDNRVVVIYRVRSSSTCKAPLTLKEPYQTVIKVPKESLNRTLTWRNHHDRTLARIDAQQPQITTHNRTVRSPLEIQVETSLIQPTSCRCTLGGVIHRCIQTQSSHTLSEVNHSKLADPHRLTNKRL